VMFMRSDFNTQASFDTLLVPTLIQGVAMATFFIPLLALAFSGLESERIASASGVINFTRLSAASFATSITTTLWSRRAALHHAQLVWSLTGNPQARQFMAQAHAQGLSTQQGAFLLNQLINRQAYMLSADDIFWVSGYLFVAMAFLIWLARPGSKSLSAEVSAGAH